MLQSPELKAAYACNGAQVTGGTPEQFRAYEKVEIEKYGKVIKASGAKAD